MKAKIESGGKEQMGHTWCCAVAENTRFDEIEGMG